LLTKRAAKRFAAFGAGLRPAEIHPLVYRVMEEIGVSIKGRAAKGIKETENRQSHSAFGTDMMLAARSVASHFRRCGLVV
jgi:hypothetical protein